jgi:hypothetical protein
VEGFWTGDSSEEGAYRGWPWGGSAGGGGEEWDRHGDWDRGRCEWGERWGIEMMGGDLSKAQQRLAGELGDVPASECRS